MKLPEKKATLIRMAHLQSNKRIVFEKGFSRDFSIIVEEAWFFALTEGVEKVFGEKNPNYPPNVFFINNGLIEVWENQKALDWLKEKLRSENSKDLSFLSNTIKEYNENLEKMKNWLEKKELSSLEGLNSFLETYFSTMVGFMLFYYTATDEKSPEEARQIAAKIREEDAFFDETDKFIRNSLRKILPAAIGFETAIVRQELQGNIPAVEELAKRKKGFVHIPGLASETMALQRFQKNHPEFFFKKPRQPAKRKPNEIKGNVAFPGMAEGFARIVRLKEELGTVKEGEIIVSPMTTPDFVPAMKKAAGFVTDEGGILCHAAIVARELKKPCIVGTGIATQILKTGDFVELDAFKGIVKMLKAAEK